MGFLKRVKRFLRKVKLLLSGNVCVHIKREASTIVEYKISQHILRREAFQKIYGGIYD